MGLFDRLSRVVRANLNDLVSKAEDPEKVLEQTIIDMNEDLIQLKQAVARSMADRNRTEQQYKQNLSESNKWEQRAKLALSKGEESLAREALVRKKTFTETATTMKGQLDMQNSQVDTLRRNLVALESKISEAKTKKNMLIARAKAAKATEEVNKTLGNMDVGSSMAAFERMENKVLDMEARSQAMGELAGTGVENQWAALESGSDVEDELAMLKAQFSGSGTGQQISGSSMDQKSLPPQGTSKDSVVDDELEQLRKQLDNL
ncbi:PspA/IM30 family protein [Aphanothece sacrum]|uniref:Phage shock protein A, PspA n=1 Tax=Aphanothece sacrum FPU1 TaxID=1920663 RepID=A0A401IM86_APHSA|nr:PspA/IM30 family protein [Aphanothece sacrum]GBF82367.1 phage shock protein A, PspA [Aphanothece sacrum FPU1]GBF84267.1 phage shock protein A [Aphanothece sacrum FPU3]